MPVERELEKTLSIAGMDVQGRLLFAFSDYHVQITVKPMGEMNTATNFGEMMRQCYLLYYRIVWGTLLYKTYILRLLGWFPLTCLPSIAPRISLKVELNSPMKSCFPLESQSQTMHWGDKREKNKRAHFSSDRKRVTLKSTTREIMICIG